MSQKSSVPQAISFVSQVLKRDTQPIYAPISAYKGSGFTIADECIVFNSQRHAASLVSQTLLLEKRLTHIV
jgi:hypothetical protein